MYSDMAKLGFFLLCSIIATGMVDSKIVYKREFPHHHHGLVDYPGYHKLHDYGHYPHFAHIHIPPAISTISYIQSHHSKPTSYSGFTNHGRGHLDPGYAIEFRQEGFLPHHHHHYGHHYY